MPNISTPVPTFGTLYVEFLLKRSYQIGTSKTELHHQEVHHVTADTMYSNMYFIHIL
jgi:hypothetical protein